MIQGINSFINKDLPAKIAENLHNGASEFYESTKLYFKCAGPYMLSATVLWGLSAKAATIQNPTVAWATSNLLLVGKIACMVKGALEFNKAVEASIATNQKSSRNDFVRSQHEPKSREDKNFEVKPTMPKPLLQVVSV